MIDHVQKYAPGLVPLAERLEPHDCVICSYSAGPQGGGGAWGDVPHIVIQPASRFTAKIPVSSPSTGNKTARFTVNMAWYSITFQGLLDYLAHGRKARFGALQNEAQHLHAPGASPTRRFSVLGVRSLRKSGWADSARARQMAKLQDKIHTYIETRESQS